MAHRLRQGPVGESEAMARIRQTISRVGPSDLPVLITGESGTGKEVIARAVHESSHRSSRKLVVVDCAAITPTLMESELFGHIKGAFTGASSTTTGLAAEADGGTLFLDEIGEVPLGSGQAPAAPRRWDLPFSGRHALSEGQPESLGRDQPRPRCRHGMR